MNYNPFNLNNKIILVTGASSGIGRSIAIECSRMGATVVITARNREKLESTLKEMEKGEHIILQADLSKEEDIINLVSKLPNLDGVVHNAGVGDRILCKMVKQSDIEKIMKPNFEGPVLLQKHLMKNKKINKESSIVFISSRAPYAPTIANGLYAASKAAIIGYAKVLGLEIAPQKIRVNTICPAMVWTELVAADAEKTGGNSLELEKLYPLKRYGRPEDIAYLTIYLLSDASNWMTGSVIDITGGNLSI